MDKTPEETQKLDRLKALGVKLAIDDFGTGYAALSYLPLFPFDCLKIDRSFVRHISESSNYAGITDAILQMARSLNLFTVAEGVEREAELAFLAEKGCAAMQGYFFSPPVPAQDMEAMLTEKRRLTVPGGQNQPG